MLRFMENRFLLNYRVYLLFFRFLVCFKIAFLHLKCQVWVFSYSKRLAVTSTIHCVRSISLCISFQNLLLTYRDRWKNNTDYSHSGLINVIDKNYWDLDPHGNHKKTTYFVKLTRSCFWQQHIRLLN